MDLERYAELFRALSNPHRLSLFVRLASCCRPSMTCDADMRACVGELGADLGIAPSTVSHHLKELRQAGLIHTRRSRQTIECWVDPGSLDELSDFFDKAGSG